MATKQAEARKVAATLKAKERATLRVAGLAEPPAVSHFQQEVSQ